MKPFFVLIISFIILILIEKQTSSDKDVLFAGNIAMSIMLLFTALGHFKFRNSMVAMLPLFVPKKFEIIIITGILEVLFAIGLGIESTKHITAIALILFLLAVLPANIYTAKHKIDYENKHKLGPGLKYLWFRIPFQFFLIVWVWYFSLQ